MPNQNPEQSPSSYNAINGSTTVSNRRDARYEKRTHLWSLTSLPRVHKCGKTPVGPVQIAVQNGVAFTRNLTTCGSVWVCPVCSAKILTKRQAEIAEVIDRWNAENGFYVFQTITIPHPKGAGVATQRLMLKTAWDSINKGRFSSLNKTYSQEGYLKVTECTYSDNGFHLHLHVIRFTKRFLGSDEVQAWGDALFGQMSKALTTKGFRAPSRKGHDFKQVEITEDWSGYFTKSFDNSSEAAASTSTIGAQTSVWNLLDKAISDPTSDYVRLWHDFEKGTFRLNQLTWSKDLRKNLGLSSLSSDEDVANEPEAAPKVVLEIEPNDVKAFVQLGHLLSQVLRHVGEANLEFALAILNEHGVRYTLFESTLARTAPPDGCV